MTVPNAIGSRNVLDSIKTDTRPPIQTTILDKALPGSLERVYRQFHALALNVQWVCDFTYVGTWQGFVIVALEQTFHQRRPAHDQPASHSPPPNLPSRTPNSW